MNKRKRYSADKRMAALETASISQAIERSRTSNSNNTLARNYDLWIQTDRAFRIALDLSSPTYPDDEIILRAFNAHNLDWKNPFHWRQLLAILASAHYGNKLPSGAKEKWTEAKHIELLTAFTTLRKEHPKWSEAKICQKLVAEDEAYSGLKGTTLQKQLQYARRSLVNEISDYLHCTRMDAFKMLRGPTPRGRKPKEFTK